MMVLMPIARIVFKKPWLTGVDKSTASIRGSLAQYSVPCAANTPKPRPTSKMQTIAADLAAENSTVGTGNVPPITGVYLPHNFRFPQVLPIFHLRGPEGGAPSSLVRRRRIDILSAPQQPKGEGGCRSGSVLGSFPASGGAPLRSGSLRAR